ncbi:hypothetical protein L7F22_015814 [Adiantum nelumboides]|nr:hypothetical protein [Adiantum nelumboides]
MEERSAAEGQDWGKAFEWKIKGASVKQVWEVTGDFCRADKWVTSLLQSCALLEGEPQKPGCVRRPVLHPPAEGEPPAYSLEKLLDMDELRYRYVYALLDGTLPGFSLMKDYVSTFKLSPLGIGDGADSSSAAAVNDDDDDEEKGTLLRWSFVCRPVAVLSEQQAQHIAFSLYQAAVNDLIARLSLPNDAVTLLSTPS